RCRGSHSARPDRSERRLFQRRTTSSKSKQTWQSLSRFLLVTWGWGWSGAASRDLGWNDRDLYPGIEWREWGFAFPVEQGNAVDGAWLLLARILGYGPGSKIGRSAQMNSDS